jgi:hypothetical protein
MDVPPGRRAAPCLPNDERAADLSAARSDGDAQELGSKVAEGFFQVIEG